MVDPTMSNINEIQQLEESIERAKERVEFGTVIERLYATRDFKKVIGEGYFEQEAIRLVHLKADPNMQSVAQQEAIVKQIDAIGSLKQYLRAKCHIAAQAVQSIAADEETRDELLSEEGEL